MINRSVEILLVIVLLCSAFFIGQSWRGNNKSLSNSATEAQEKVETLKLQIQELYDTDLQDYARLKSLEAKYQSANNILAKMMTIFLAELGLKMSKQNIGEITTPIQGNTPQSSQNSSSQNCTPVEKLSCPSLQQMAKDQGKVLMDAHQKIKKSKPDWTEKEKNFQKSIRKKRPKTF